VTAGGDICALLNEAEELTKANTKLNLVVAFNYGSRAEIAAAARRLAREVARESAIPLDRRDTLGQYLDAPDIPDPTDHPHQRRAAIVELRCGRRYSDSCSCDPLAGFRQGGARKRDRRICRRERRFGVWPRNRIVTEAKPRRGSGRTGSRIL